MNIKNKRRFLNNKKKFLDLDKEGKEFFDKKILDNRFQKYQFRSLRKLRCEEVEELSTSRLLKRKFEIEN